MNETLAGPAFGTLWLAIDHSSPHSWLVPLTVGMPMTGVRRCGGRGPVISPKNPVIGFCTQRNVRKSVFRRNRPTLAVDCVARTTRMWGSSQSPSKFRMSLAFVTFSAATFPRGPDGVWTGTLVYSIVYNNERSQTASAFSEGVWQNHLRAVTRVYGEPATHAAPPRAPPPPPPRESILKDRLSNRILTKSFGVNVGSSLWPIKRKLSHGDSKQQIEYQPAGSYQSGDLNSRSPPPKPAPRDIPSMSKYLAICWRECTRVEKWNEVILSLWVVNQERNDAGPRGGLRCLCGRKVYKYIYFRLSLEEYTGNQ